MEFTVSFRRKRRRYVVSSLSTTSSKALMLRPVDVNVGRRIEIDKDRVLSVRQRISAPSFVFDVAVAEPKAMQVTVYQFETEVP